MTCITGPSGCGKTTLIEYISELYIESGLNVGYVFQEDRLIPWKTLYDNLFLISKQYYYGNEQEEIIDAVLRDVNLIEYKNYFPKQLSGGMKQRVNIARALINKPDILIMDEPFKSIDNKMKFKIIENMKKFFFEENITVILVSHDEEEINLLGNTKIKLNYRPVRIEEKTKIALK